MFQKEVGDRICAEYGSKDYGRLSIMSNWRLNVKKNFEISNNSFYPKPKVKSVVLTFKPKNNLYKFNNPKSLETITRVFFSNKRKMINKAYKKIFNKDHSIKNRLNINLNLRPENLTFHDYYKLSEEFEKI